MTKTKKKKRPSEYNIYHTTKGKTKYVQTLLKLVHNFMLQLHNASTNAIMSEKKSS